jgi:LuxR family maltose regulon positive regulatory protein
MNEALTLGEPEGYVRTFVDLGEPMRLLIADCRLQIERQSRVPFPMTAPVLIDYINRLLAAFGQITSAVEPTSIINQKSAINNLVEPLTERELEILRLLPTELSTRELAEYLVVSINTVKTQLKSIYAKLDTHSREEAVEKARALNLL